MATKGVKSMKLIIESISKAFKDNIVFNNASCELEQGRIYALLGRNGSGKTTLFDLISKRKTLENGEIYLLDGDDRIEINHDNLFYMVANPLLPNFLTGREFFKFFIDVNKDKIKRDIDIDNFFDLLSFDKREADRLIQTYSLGTKNKLQMMMFLILKPKIILMDEPLTSLDVVVQSEIKKVLKDIHKDHIIIFSTHILQLAKDICDEIVILHNNQLKLLEDLDIEDKEFEEKIINILKGEEVSDEEFITSV